MSGPDYLFDPKAPVDPDDRSVAEAVELERLLGRFGHRGRELRPARPRRPWLPLISALVAAALIVALVLAWHTGSTPPARDGLRVVRGDGRAAVGLAEWFEATETERELNIDAHAMLTLEPGSRLQVKRLDAAQTRFYLAEGRLEAFVFPSVRARFFQVETPATTCVDLGCRYTLDVDPATGAAQVRVTMGQVAFVDGDREVFVPRGAECRALPGRGSGTPSFSDCADDLRDALDRYDAAAVSARGTVASAVAAAAGSLRDTLPLWHLLADGEAAVQRTAEEALVRLAGMPAGVKGAATPERWRVHLEPHWW